MKCRQKGSFASLPSYTQRFVFIFFRHIEKDKKEAVLRTWCSDRGDGDECAPCPTWTWDPALRLLLPWKQPPPGTQGPLPPSLTGAHRRTEETRNRLLLNQVISQQSVQWDTRGVLPLFHFYKIKPTGNTAHLGTGWSRFGYLIFFLFFYTNKNYIQGTLQINMFENLMWNKSSLRVDGYIITKQNPEQDACSVFCPP